MTEKALDMARHVALLCTNNQIEIVTYKGNGRAVAYRNSPLKIIKIRPIRGPVSYFIALHEVGHLIGPGRSAPKLEREANAWVFALRRAMRPPTESVKKHIRSSLQSYLHAGRRDWGLRQNMVEPQKDHVFWKLIEEGDL